MRFADQIGKEESKSRRSVIGSDGEASGSLKSRVAGMSIVGS